MAARWQVFFGYLLSSSGLTNSPLEMAALAYDCDVFKKKKNSPGVSILDNSEIPPQRCRGNNISVLDKSNRGGAYSHAYILQKFAAGFMKVTASHKEQTPP